MEMEIYGHFPFLDINMYRKPVGSGIVQQV
jgi:hypothetical protein